jgi:hypothetical protein
MLVLKIYIHGEHFQRINYFEVEDDVMIKIVEAMPLQNS